MRQGITICTWSGGQEGLENLLATLKGCEYELLIWVNDGLNAKFTLSQQWLDDYLSGFVHPELYLSDIDGYEIGAIYGTLEATDWDEFVFLQDTIEIKNLSVFDRMFKEFEGRSVAYNPHFQMYLGKFRRAILEGIPKPEVRNKIDAVSKESSFTQTYWANDPTTVVLNPHFIDQNFYGRREWKHGRENLVMEDDYIKKFKGTWDAKSQL